MRHDRRINMAQDDSVVFVRKDTASGAKEPLFIRRARGYVPLPLNLKKASKHEKTVLSLGGDLKSTFSFGKKDRIVTSQYIGDLEDLECFENFKDYIED